MVSTCHSDVLAAADSRWVEALTRVRHDVYHTAAYHGLGGLGREGEAFVFLHQEGDDVFLWPYLLTPTAAGASDVTSVYGYAGPVARGDEEFVGRAWRNLLEAWRGQRVVSAFTRFHPLLENRELARGLVDGYGQAVDEGVRLHGPTVSMDLRPSLDEQFRKYHKNLRNEIRRAKEAGLATTEDGDWEHVDEFVRLYQDSMTRLNSRRDYLVDADWVREFRRVLGKQAYLFVTKVNGVVAAAMLVMGHAPFLHAHLVGSNPDLVAQSPTKALLDGVRIWATERGFETFHLGGGVGGREDSLYQSKRKFSPLTHEFYTGSWILDGEQYRDLAASHRRKLLGRGIDLGDPGFFPIYRYEPE